MNLAARTFLAAALAAPPAACMTPAGLQAPLPHVVMTPDSVAARVDAAVVVVPSAPADAAALGARGVVQPMVPPPAQRMPPHAAPAAVDLPGARA